MPQIPKETSIEESIVLLPFRYHCAYSTGHRLNISKRANY